MTAIAVKMPGIPAFEFDVYFSEKAGTPVVHVDTGNLDENANGPICRVYLNDEAIYENPKLREEDSSGT